MNSGAEGLKHRLRQQSEQSKNEFKKKRLNQHETPNEKHSVRVRWARRKERETASGDTLKRELLTGNWGSWNSGGIHSTMQRKKEKNKEAEGWKTRNRRGVACMYVCMWKCVRARARSCMSRVERGLHGWAIPVQLAGWLWVCAAGGPREGFDHYRVWQKSSDREVTPQPNTHTHQ